nr:unnamed protein product [Callosobruchus analis]
MIAMVKWLIKNLLLESKAQL